MNINDATRWSRLSRFGKSGLARITILAPFLGFLVFLNLNLSEYITLKEYEFSVAWLNYLAERRLELLYLGLILVGFSVGVFGLLAPDTIKSSEKYSEHIDFKEATKTNNAVVGSLEDTIEHFTKYIRFSSESFYDLPRTAALPDKCHDSFHRLVCSLYETSDVGTDGEYSLMNGVIDFDKVLDGISSRRRVEWVLWKPFFAKCPDYSIDVFRLEYLIKDYSLPGLRLLVFTLFSLGTIVTLIPTFVSVILVIQDGFLS